MHWKRKWQPTPVFLPGEFQGWGSLVGCRLWSHTESETTEVTQQQQQHTYIHIWVTTFGFYKLHSLAYIWFSSRGHHMHNKYFFIPTYTSEKAMAPHSSALAWKTQGRRSLVGYSPWGREVLDTTEQLHFHFSRSCTGEGNGNPHQCSCQGWGSLVGCHLWGHTESDTTEAT